MSFKLSVLLKSGRKMVGDGANHPRRKISPEVITRSLISFISAMLTQLSLLLIPSFFPSFSLYVHLLLSAVVILLAIGFGQHFRQLFGFRGSAPAFVFFHIVFIWLVYLGLIRQAVSTSMDIILNVELVILVIGFIRILLSDPGFVHYGAPNLVEGGSVSEEGNHPQELELVARADDIQTYDEMTFLSSRRVRYCRSCKAYVRGFDHHCPAFGNCIGVTRYKNPGTIGTKSNFYESLAVSTMLFSLLQVLWQVVFLAWHIYCICFNIRTDEWIHWERYPEFHVVIEPPLDQSSPELMFRNPYDKGIIYNLKDFLLGRGQDTN